jgi:hypothetical protein
MNVLKQSWFWAVLTGLVLGFYAGYHVGLVAGYDRVLETLHGVSAHP